MTLGERLDFWLEKYMHNTIRQSSYDSYKHLTENYIKPILYQASDSLWEGSYFPRLPDGKRKKYNVYAKTREESEVLLAEMIPKVKTEIAEAKAKLKTTQSV